MGGKRRRERERVGRERGGREKGERMGRVYIN